MTEILTANRTEPPPSPRLLSLDTFRGLIMCTLAVNGFALATTAKKLGVGGSGANGRVMSGVWEMLAFHNSHPPWNSQFFVIGYSYWDMIQPAFMFMVGVAMPYSYASRLGRGDTRFKLASHALTRAILLVLLGGFLQTRNGGLDTNALFTNVLGQIGLGYFFVYLTLGLSTRVQIAIAATVLAGYTAFLNVYRIPEWIPENAIQSVRSLSVQPGLAAHYAIETNAAAQVDVTFLRWLLSNDSIEPHRGGYATLNFIPAAITMLIGVVAGTLLRSPVDASVKLKRLIMGGVICLTLAVVMSFTCCPVIKRIWTPSWTLYSGAYVLWTLAILYWFVDVAGYRRWTFPLVVVGTNSLAMYLMSMLLKRWIAERFQVYLGDDVFSGTFGPMLQAASVFAVLWLFCLYLFRNKLFFRI